MWESSEGTSLRRKCKICRIAMQPHDAGKAGVDKYEGPEGQHSCEANGVDGSLVGGYLTGEPPWLR